MVGIENSLSTQTDRSSLLGIQLQNVNNQLISEFQRENSGINVQSNTALVKASILLEQAQEGSLSAQLLLKNSAEGRQALENAQAAQSGELAGEDHTTGDAIAATAGGRTYSFTTTVQTDSRLPGAETQVTLPSGSSGNITPVGNVGSFPSQGSGDSGAYSAQGSPPVAGVLNPCDLPPAGGFIGGLGSRPPGGGGGGSIDVTDGGDPFAPSPDPNPPWAAPPQPDPPEEPEPDDDPPEDEPEPPTPPEPQRFQCLTTEGRCVPSPKGIYASYQECVRACQRSGWACENGNCVEIPGLLNGFASRAECEASGCTEPCGSYTLNIEYTRLNGVTGTCEENLVTATRTIVGRNFSLVLLTPKTITTGACDGRSVFGRIDINYTDCSDNPASQTLVDAPNNLNATEGSIVSQTPDF